MHQGTIGMTGGLKLTQEQGSAWETGLFPASVQTKIVAGIFFYVLWFIDL